MISRRENGVPFFEFPNLASLPGIRHGVFTRKGGASLGPYAALNVGQSLGDRPEAVASNRERVSRCLGNLRLAFIRQVHGTDVVVLKNGAPEVADPDTLPAADAMVTDIPRTGLVIQTADCQAVMLYDPRQRVAANVHSGWRGSIRNIIGKTVGAMTSRFRCDPRDIRAGIGPSLGPCCAEFIHYRNEIPREFWKYKGENRHFDFWSASRDQLLNAGVPEEHIFTSRLCTRCRTDLFFSYRGEHATGRLAMVIGLG
ncbi:MULTISPECIES: peptidoglycan editing factor PgeF [Desulfococcus]|jgi:YfiH family protein|uniref:Purine nucleoside phosphorylase n=1 Tax=Desulfococcus multivorans DSM 2059 TaxID=1121405 RepID=S7TXN1_DESML|nr:peptidoglycan editing factor PgeF [Desulfococcus multivorans]AOY57094.1 conserved uncharacterized protein, YfiH family [Desulfococcus multivorans]AQU99602.1 multicopper polyphenol oxidase [Desulfococcus multivorans]EPR41802.1 Multi-copper polyphenol oxidoreductase, laccase [Desulfococcus multivorans DSM 2059]MDX9818550.1 peptidoglycan editing factor PgeF [Desulfococcus multivorans]SJZ87708.1 conserved hypothetical protein [Desulfococcus multivorans DSM 2059]